MSPEVEELLVTWRKTRDPALADAIEKALPLAELASPIDEAKTTKAHLTAMMQLVNRPADPRVATILVGQLEKPRYTAQSGKPTWRLVLDELGGVHADPRTIARLAPLIERYRFIFGATVMADWMINQMKKLVASLRERFPNVTLPATPKEAAPKSNKPTSEAAFIASIAVDPDDDAPRLVFADWLLERNDPRGEFMTLQFRRHRGDALSVEDEAREAALIKAHAAKWLGPFASCTRDWRFERGCLAACALDGKKFPAESVNHPFWATVKELGIGRRGKTSDKTTRDIVMAPVMRQLRGLRDVPAVALASIVNASEPWTRLEVLEAATYEPELSGVPPAYPPAIWKPLLAGTALPALKTLSLAPYMHNELHLVFADLWTSPLAEHLAKVELRYLREWDVPAIFADVREKARGLSLEIVCSHWTLRPKNGEHSELEITSSSNFAGLVEALTTLPADSLTSLKFTLETPFDPEQAKEVARVMKRFRA